MEPFCNKSADPLTKRQDLIHIAILLIIALGIGIYLITTTVVITKDGAFYIQEAGKFSSNPQAVIKRRPFGFPLLIFLSHKLVTIFSNSSSLFTWIYPAQSIALLCRLLSLIPLYFIGTILVGNKKSFWAVLILIILPYPAEFGSDALREWPHILFLASGLLFLFLAVKHSKYWMFGAAGFLAGLGQIIRPECAQIIIYGILWICIRLLSPKPGMSRPRLLCALLVLLIGFAIPAAPYMTARGRVLPAKLKIMISSAGPEESKEILELEIDSDDIIYPVRYAKTLSHGVNTASGMPRKIAKAFGELAGAMSENLMYYFLPVLLIGIYFRFRKNSSAAKAERLIMPAFVVINIFMLIALYYYFGYLSRRHCLPLVALTIFYVPIGLQVSADWLAYRFSPARDGLRHKSRPASDQDRRRWFFILLIIGTAICLPKLLSRPGSDKPGYRTAAAWLKENTTKDDLIAVPDRRITFYAERKEIVYETAPPGKADYVVLIVKDENQVPGFVGDAQKKFSVWQNERRKNKKIVVYKMP